jgi:hypothetical protein
VYPAGYWLVHANPNETFTVDLGGQYIISSITLYNTHNRDNNDRGTQDFTIWISATAVVPDTNPGSTFGTQVLSGTLAFHAYDNPNTPQPFALVSATTGRYVTFRERSWYCPTGNCSAGLSEIEVFGEPAGVLEPGSITLFVIGAIMLPVIRRRLAAR